MLWGVVLLFSGREGRETPAAATKNGRVTAVMPVN